LHEAAKRGNLAIVRLLVRAGVDVWSCDYNGHTVFDVALENKYGADDVIYQYLLGLVSRGSND
jgi:ankyrin repeat protein